MLAVTERIDNSINRNQSITSYALSKVKESLPLDREPSE